MLRTSERCFTIQLHFSVDFYLKFYFLKNTVSCSDMFVGMYGLYTVLIGKLWTKNFQFLIKSEGFFLILGSVVICNPSYCPHYSELVNVCV